MSKSKDAHAPKFADIRYRLTNPDVDLNAAQFEQLAITAEDLRYLENLADTGGIDNPPTIRSVSVILRRLFCSSGDFHKVVNQFQWKEPITVLARVIDYPEPQSLWIVSAGNYIWGDDLLPGTSAQLGGATIAPQERTWNLLDDVRLDLSTYLESMAFCILGTRVKRHQVIRFIANKKAAHVSGDRKVPAETKLDQIWQMLYIDRVDPDENVERLNSVYLELATIVHTLAASESLRAFVAALIDWLTAAEMYFDPEDAKEARHQFQMKRTGRR